MKTVATIPLPLPDPRTYFYDEVFGLVWPQILTFSAAIVVIAGTIYLVRAISKT